MNQIDSIVLAYLASWILSTRNALTPTVRNQRVWRVAAVLLTIGLTALTAAQMIGSSLDKDGFLHEPFYLIGSGSLLSLAGSGITFLLVLLGLFSRLCAKLEKGQWA